MARKAEGEKPVGAAHPTAPRRRPRELDEAAEFRAVAPPVMSFGQGRRR